MTLDTHKIARAHIAVAKAHLELAGLFDPKIASPMPFQERRDLIVSLMPASVDDLREKMPTGVRVETIRNDLRALLKQGRIRRIEPGSFALKKKRR